MIRDKSLGNSQLKPEYTVFQLLWVPKGHVFLASPIKIKYLFFFYHFIIFYLGVFFFFFFYWISMLVSTAQWPAVFAFSTNQMKQQNMLTVLFLNHFIVHHFEKCQYNCCQSNVVTCFFWHGNKWEQATPMARVKHVTYCIFKEFIHIVLPVSVEAAHWRQFRR